MKLRSMPLTVNLHKETVLLTNYTHHLKFIRFRLCRYTAFIDIMISELCQILLHYTKLNNSHNRTNKQDLELKSLFTQLNVFETKLDKQFRVMQASIRKLLPKIQAGLREAQKKQLVMLLCFPELSHSECVAYYQDEIVKRPHLLDFMVEGSDEGSDQVY